MNPLAKAIGTLLVFTASALGATLDHGIPLPVHHASQGDGTDGASGNDTGNDTADGNSTADGNQTSGDAGNETSDGNSTASDGNATGNQTTGGDAGNATAEPTPAEHAAVCDFYVDDYGDDLTPQHHEWEWAVTNDVTRLSVQFYAYGGIPTGLSGHPEARLVDGSGRTLARTTSSDGSISMSLERGVDYLANGQWRLEFDSSELFSDYYAQVSLHCGPDPDSGSGDGADSDGE